VHSSFVIIQYVLYGSSVMIMIRPPGKKLVKSKKKLLKKAPYVFAVFLPFSNRISYSEGGKLRIPHSKYLSVG